jgi:hypothetical protein
MMSRRKHGRWLSGIAHCFRCALLALHELVGELFFFSLLLRQSRWCLVLSESLSCCAMVRVWTVATFGFAFRFIFSTRSEWLRLFFPPEVGFCIGDTHMKQVPLDAGHVVDPQRHPAGVLKLQFPRPVSRVV